MMMKWKTFFQIDAFSSATIKQNKYLMPVYFYLERQIGDWIQTKSFDNTEHAQQLSEIWPQVHF